MAGLERELAPNLAVSAAYTWRKSTDLTATQLLSGYYWYSWIGVTSADYHLGSAGHRQRLHRHAVRRSTTGWRTASPAGSSSATGRTSAAPSRASSCRFVKRLSNNWMAPRRLLLQRLEGARRAGRDHQPHPPRPRPADRRRAVGRRSAPGRARTTTRTRKWQVNVNGLYQLPAGFEIAANLFGRQGYPKPVYMLLDTGALDGNLNVLAVNEIDEVRLPNLWNLDAAPGQELQVRPHAT